MKIQREISPNSRALKDLFVGQHREEATAGVVTYSPEISSRESDEFYRYSDFAPASHKLEEL